MEFNQYANEYHQLSALVDAWDRKVSETGKKLAWYGGFNLVTAGQEIDQARAEITGKEKQVKILDSEIWEITNKDKEREHELGSNFNPLNWFSAHQRDIKLARKVLQHAIREKQTQRSAQLSAILGIRNKILQRESDIRDYHATNKAELSAAFADGKEKLIHFKQDLAAASKKKQQIELKLAPCLREMESKEAEIQNSRNRIDAAKNFDRRLDAAANTYEKKMIHGECEQSLGDGKPRKVISVEESKIRRLEDDLRKSRARASDIVKKASRSIDTIVVDGSNLCYQGSTFLGLSPLISASAALRESYRVVIVFDASIRQKLRAGDQEIEALLGSRPDDLEVHIVATKQRADETILDLAERSSSTYVLSNDRFGEFGDKQVVKQERLIRHSIVNGYVLIAELDVNEQFSSTQ